MALLGEGAYNLAGLLSQLPTFSGRPNPVGALGPALFQMGQQARQQAQKQQLTESLRGLLEPQQRPMEMQGAMAGGVLPKTAEDIQQQPGLLAQSPMLEQYVTGLLDAGMPEQANQIVGGLLTQGGGDYKNVQVDDLGRFWGVRNGRVEQIPMQGGFTKYKTVQSTDERGMPITELVSPGLIGAPQPRITVGTKTTLPTQEEAKSIAQAENAETMLGELENLVTSENAPEIGPTANLIREAKTLPVIGSIADMLGQGLSTNDARVISLTTSLSNQMLAALRGAQVGPEEQTKFEKQLPMPGQPIGLFVENLKNTRKNLVYINRRKKELRGINQQNTIDFNDLPD